MTAHANRKTRVPTGAADRAFDIINVLVMALIAVVTLYPFWYCVILSLNDGLDALKGPLYIWPRVFTTENYVFVFNSPYLMLALRNSVLRTVIGTVLHCAFTGIIAFALNRRDLIGRKAYMVYFAFTMYFGGGLIPTYLLIRNLGLIDNFLVYVIPSMFSFYNAILFLAYYQSIPYELEESAMIDGAGVLTIFLRIIFPTALPIYATIALFSGVGQWNSYFDTIIYTSSDRLITLQSVLAKMIAIADVQREMNSKLQTGSSAFQRVSPMTMRVATMLITTLPITLAYPFLQRYFVKGIMLGSVKG